MALLACSHESLDRCIVRHHQPLEQVDALRGHVLPPRVSEHVSLPRNGDTACALLAPPAHRACVHPGSDDTVVARADDGDARVGRRAAAEAEDQVGQNVGECLILRHAEVEIFDRERRRFEGHGQRRRGYVAFGEECPGGAIERAAAGRVSATNQVGGVDKERREEQANGLEEEQAQ
eukprot:CAMPEP_0180086430 /NCGR_PEP_ID=MMETSP0985-20121206/21046_1 /TAXON_ID=483367 /ORGANISM="non described non described, Strain CCMP 2436" /LENGTH=176 /DNA_ID=CAMNT_0022020469 /DNA_START=72 /DNA_END=602 /DNA_ORIENTATION=-